MSAAQRRIEYKILVLKYKANIRKLYTENSDMPGCSTVSLGK